MVKLFNIFQYVLMSIFKNLLDYSLILVFHITYLFKSVKLENILIQSIHLQCIQDLKILFVFKILCQTNKLKLIRTYCLGHVNPKSSHNLLEHSSPCLAAGNYGISVGNPSSRVPNKINYFLLFFTCPCYLKQISNHTCSI